MRKNNGFTLIELLATIVVLSCVMAVSIYGATYIVNKSKEKSYSVVVNNIEKVAESYVLDNNEKLIYISNNDKKTEYQCVTVDNLIEYGYLKSNVINSKKSEDEVVKKDDYIYIERNADTSSVTKNILIDKNDNNYNLKCESSRMMIGNIEYQITSSGWQKEKKVVIKYSLKNYNNINDYSFGYSLDNKDVFDDTLSKEVIVNSNSDIVAAIKLNDHVELEKTIKVDMIDNTSPVVSLNTNGDENYSKNKNIVVTITDIESGLVPNGVTKYGWGTSNTVEPGSYENVELQYDVDMKKATFNVNNDNMSGSYYLWVVTSVVDKCGNEAQKYISKVFNFDNTLPVMTVSPNDETKSYTIPMEVSLTCSDSNSGIKSAEINENGTKKMGVDKATYTFSLIKDGSTETIFTCIDKAGNTTTKSYKYKIIAPVAAPSTGGSGGSSYSDGNVVSSPQAVYIVTNGVGEVIYEGSDYSQAKSALNNAPYQSHGGVNNGLLYSEINGSKTLTEKQVRNADGSVDHYSFYSGATEKKQVKGAAQVPSKSTTNSGSTSSGSTGSNKSTTSSKTTTSTSKTTTSTSKTTTSTSKTTTSTSKSSSSSSSSGGGFFSKAWNTVKSWFK